MSAPRAVEAEIRPDLAPVEVDNVSVRFGAIKALSEVSFTVEPGTIHAIIGPNGAGKSTMFNVLSGVYNVAASRDHWAPTTWLIELALNRSVSLYSLTVGAPPPLEDPDLIRLGAGHYHGGKRTH